jgi:hypothetical protein
LEGFLVVQYDEKVWFTEDKKIKRVARKRLRKEKQVSQIDPSPNKSSWQ